MCPAEPLSFYHLIRQWMLRMRALCLLEIPQELQGAHILV